MFRIGCNEFKSENLVLASPAERIINTRQSTSAHTGQSKCNCQFIPPHIQKNIRDASEELHREHAELIDSHRISSQQIRKQRCDFNHDSPQQANQIVKTSPSTPLINRIFNAKNKEVVPGKEMNSLKIGLDKSARRAQEGAQNTIKFYKEIYNRDSIDGRHMPLISTIHFGHKYSNAFWNGEQMVYGDGDGLVFTDFTKDIDVVSHELTHGVTQHTCNLVYEGQSGALNEHLSDVAGAQIKQYVNKQTAEQADWLIGDIVLIGKGALRSMKDPGKAYNEENTPLLGNDPQPASMDNYQDLPIDDDHDQGGVHINSGIPNKAFYLVSTQLGGHSWEKAGKIWYLTSTNPALEPTANFAQFSELTIQSAIKLYGPDSVEHKAVVSAWRQVKVIQ